MTRRRVTDEQYGQLWRKLTEVARRVDEGTIEFGKVMGSLQGIIESVFESVFSLIIDYTQSLEKMIAAGHYDWKNDDITQEHFPIKGSGRQEVEAVLFHFNRMVSSEQMISEMEKAGYEPGKIEHLLALGASQPDLQRRFPIVALGSSWVDPVGDRGVPYLDGDASGRDLRLRWFKHDWLASDRFLAARK